MKFSGSDFHLLRWSLTAISVSVILSSIVLYSSQQYADHTRLDFLAAQQQMNDAHSRLQIAHQDQENLATYSQDYRALEERNIIGDNHRLSWIEGLEKLRQRNIVIDFRYHIAPQKIYALQPAVDSGNFDIHYSEMKLQFELLHEGQLLNFFNALRSQINGQYQLEGCTLLRNAANSQDDNDDDDTPAIATNIKAECGGGWITLKNRNAQP